MSVLMDELEAAPIEPLLLPLPSDARALRVADHVSESPADGHDSGGAGPARAD